MLHRRWTFVAVIAVLASGAGCSRGSRPPNTIEAAKKELHELDIARKKEWVPPEH